MSFWKSLFGGGSGGGAAKPARQEDYNGYTIEAAPVMEGGQYQVAGKISKMVDGEVKVHSFLRADRFSSFEDAQSFTLVKARQIIDQTGDRIFR
jgi:hypothetical protein